MDKQIKILGIAGSLRRGSYNKGALRAAQELVPNNASIEIYEDLGMIPPFNQDFEYNPPKSVKELKAKVRVADAILFATPEYNYSFPGILKNAIDWVSRPYDDNAWHGKIAAIMGASTSVLGTARAQYQLRQVFIFPDIITLNKPEVMISYAKEKFDNDGNLVDLETRDKIKELLEALIDFVEVRREGHHTEIEMISNNRWQKSK
jgi:chromate reductase